ncbi:MULTISPECIES: hypothetical protein [Moraxella]|uniref:DUF2281 domain-containing protein n=1 Tax=Moraxella lacunata TaxID=477 RepID=A0A1B8Q1S0_MORLA|nr:MULTISPECIES: hypothetical protein [Moraxella]MBE9578569.1 hypothetical protein [Moraxella sp. K1664]MBE9588224.1 hypothetical protein [Moraxella sp. K1630]MBE9596108.1 hypothetical protein [Moraxella sp. K2450]MDH9218383.1 hypothetical protein [Moraxella lacunata]MDI4482614.1 hypothetical protein [Moraxella lacunata]
MQTSNTALSPKVQAILPMLQELTNEERFSVIDFLKNQNIMQSKKKLAPLDIQIFDEVYMSDDFNDDLGDEFWLGKDA